VRLLHFYCIGKIHCVELYIYIYIYTHTHTYIYIYTHTHTHPQTHKHTHTPTPTNTHTYPHTPTNTHTHTHPHTPTSKPTNTHKHTHTHTYYIAMYSTYALYRPVRPLEIQSYTTEHVAVNLLTTMKHAVLNCNFVFDLRDVFQERNPSVKRDLAVLVRSAC